jgi:hypothetical protein
LLQKLIQSVARVADDKDWPKVHGLFIVKQNFHQFNTNLGLSGARRTIQVEKQ